MAEVERSEKRATLEDIMYASVLEKFLELGVDMLGSMELIQVHRSREVLGLRCKNLRRTACRIERCLGAAAATAVAVCA